MEGALNPLLVRAWLSMLLLEHGVDLFRAKGILHLADRDEQFIFQSVHMLFDCVSGRPWAQTAASIVWSLSGATWTARC